MKKFYNVLCIFCTLIFTLVFMGVPAFGEEGTVRAVIDGDTLIVGHETIRLLGINTPEKAHGNTPAEPGAADATKALKALTMPGGKGVKLTLKFDSNKKDQYGRTLAHAYLPDGTWLNQELLHQGVAHVYSFPDNRKHVKELLKTEAEARNQKKGLWAHKNWQVLDATTLTPDTRIGQYRLVSGTPISTATVKNKIYLNYGADWHTDFSIEVPKKFWPLFKEASLNPADFVGKPIVVRGRLKPVNGVLITVTHPEQIWQEGN